jgi:FkbM family methyltransferase
MLIPDVFARFPAARPQRGILHVGAHLCEEAELYASLGFDPAGPNVLWIEANADIAAAAARRLRGAQNIVCAAVSHADDKTETFHITNNGQSSSLLPLAEHRNEHPDVYEIATRNVQTITLDTLFARRGLAPDTFDVANLDIQGAELLALLGARTIIPHLRAIYTEVNTKPLYAGCALLHEMDAFLATDGFTRVALEMTNHGWGDALYLRV